MQIVRRRKVWAKDSALWSGKTGFLSQVFMPGVWCMIEHHYDYSFLSSVLVAKLCAPRPLSLARPLSRTFIADSSVLQIEFSRHTAGSNMRRFILFVFCVRIDKVCQRRPNTPMQDSDVGYPRRDFVDLLLHSCSLSVRACIFWSCGCIEDLHTCQRRICIR